MAALFAARSGAPHSSTFAPEFVRAHARPDACVANGPCMHGSRTSAHAQRPETPGQTDVWGAPAAEERARMVCGAP
eukprot:37364-Prymnesium_polylepis.1